MKTNKKNHKILFFIVFVFVLVSAFVIATLDGTTFTISDVNATANTSVGIPIKLDNNNTVYGIQFELRQNTTHLVYKNVSLTSRTINATVGINETQQKVTVVLVTDVGIVPGNGTILNLIFDVNESASNKSFILNATALLVLNEDIEAIETNSVAGNITITTS